MHRHAEMLALDVPQRDVDAAQPLDHDALLPVIAQARVDHLPQHVGAQRILADQPAARRFAPRPRSSGPVRSTHPSRSGRRRSRSRPASRCGCRTRRANRRRAASSLASRMWVRTWVIFIADIPSSVHRVSSSAQIDGADDAARQEVDGGLAAELVARAALDQARAEAALHRGRHRRAAALGPDQAQPRLAGVFGDDLPVQRHPCRSRWTTRRISRRWWRSHARSSTAPPQAAATAARAGRSCGCGRDCCSRNGCSTRPITVLQLRALPISPG